MDILLVRQSIRSSAEFSFSRSGGPGGQNVNKLNTKVTLRLTLSLLKGLSEAEQNRLREKLGSRLSCGDGKELVISSSEERSQKINLERAYARAEALIVTSARLPKKRKPSKPSAAVRENRLKVKHLQSTKKTNRRFLNDEN
ncbi:MAG: aminoacyl-tRNA hydrolase [Treponema sp.]|nr:aminoacyl-tRNA hydrolase [Treponema sp.]